jgi:RNA polymerase sigma factor (sigma-70 family)
MPVWSFVVMVISAGMGFAEGIPSVQLLYSGKRRKTGVIIFVNFGNKVVTPVVVVFMELTVPAAIAFDTVTAPHLDAAYNLARWLTGNPHDAEDVVQDAWMRAYRAFEGFRGGDGRAWLLTIVRNTCYSWLQQRRRLDTQPYDQTSHDAAAEQPAAHQADPESLLLREDQLKTIGLGLQLLPHEFREVLVLRELEDLSYQQIADVTGVPIMSRLCRARRLLRAAIEQLERQPS